MFWFDRAQRSVVTGCYQCGWRAVAGNQVQADALVLDHIDRAHPGPTPEQERALTAVRVRRHRRT